MASGDLEKLKDVTLEISQVGMVSRVPQAVAQGVGLVLLFVRRETFVENSIRLNWDGNLMIWNGFGDASC